MMLTGLPLFANVNRVAQTLRVLNKDGVGKTSFGEGELGVSTFARKASSTTTTRHLARINSTIRKPTIPTTAIAMADQRNEHYVYVLREQVAPDNIASSLF
ncbi:hypothetical protein PC128_g27516 [Phytophthora cactorum]|nr:hypothetical protein PC128_g27516 [Phytophthora cactorum]